jgi:uncharacterized protein (DUF427 family)
MPIEMDKRYNGHKRLLGLVEPTYKRVRAVFNGETIADTPEAYLLYDHIYAPRYLFRKSDVDMDALNAHAETDHNRMYGAITHHDITVGDRTAEKAAHTYEHPREGYDDIGDFVGFDWNAIDQWFIEDEEVIGHARHPYLRTDVRDTSRRIQVTINGQIVADSTNATVLFETGLLPRYYIPIEDINRDYLHPTSTHTVCPYKGVASYYDVIVDGKKVEDAAWYYPTPDRGLETLMGKLAFYNEHNDITITVEDR